MGHYLPAEETLDHTALRALQRRKLSAMLRDVLATNTFYRRKLKALDPGAEAGWVDAVTDSLDALPFTTRSELQQDQIDHPPYGTNLTYPIERYTRLHETSGSAGVPLRWLDTAASWTWWHRCWAIIYAAAGVTAADRFLFPFSFGPFIGFWGAFERAAAAGHLCLPAGGMSTAARLRFMIDHGITVVCCTPTYALRMAHVAAQEGIDLRPTAVRALIVAGEPGGSIPATRARLEDAWGARVFDHTGMTEAGPLGFACDAAPGGVHLCESECIAEVIDPDSGEPVADGRCGELVVTNLGRWGSPVIRYRTGDRVCVTRRRCGCGRSFARMEGGILGRFDDMFVVRGNNVFPAAIEGVIRTFVEIVEFRLTVTGDRGMAELRIDIEPEPGATRESLAVDVQRAVRDRLGFRPAVETVPPGTLPRFEMKARRVVHRDAPDENTPPHGASAP
ncbi:MAG: phenylacetate--CoA ligase family protein [Phycisphaerae bacterium]